MLHRIHHIMNFLPRRMKPQVKELYTSSLILNLGLGLIFIFEPIYLYRLGYSLQEIMLFWGIVYLVYIVLLPRGGKIAERIGYEPGIFFGTI
ncbi:MAG: hypothetical protein NUV82_00275, partial [Candidatus Komeilibacteria bacterium]|nr:hypothetical protein [Candidatus Komeilibacteria bacterium]